MEISVCQLYYKQVVMDGYETRPLRFTLSTWAGKAGPWPGGHGLNDKDKGEPHDRVRLNYPGPHRRLGRTDP